MGPARTVLAALALAASCGGEEDKGPTSTGEQLYATHNCATCHRADGSGNNFGPTLAQVAEYWTRESLAAYLADPAGHVAKDPRLMALSRNFSMKMPPVRASEEHRLALADYVLGLAAKKP